LGLHSARRCSREIQFLMNRDPLLGFLRTLNVFFP
jgi:hypothetical protein